MNAFDDSKQSASTLRQVLDFDLHDLQANREGFMSSAQVSRLRMYNTLQMPLYGLMTTIMVALLISVMIHLPLNGRIVFICLTLRILVVTGRFLYRLIRDFPRLRRDLREQRLQVQTGVIWLYREELNAPSLQMGIDGDRFDITDALFDTLHHSKVYTLYYTPHSRRILSIETPDQEKRLDALYNEQVTAAYKKSNLRRMC